MITRYSDLAANERTYLAWMRTSLALIAFGFLLERFDLMISTFTSSMMDGSKSPLPPSVGKEAGILLVAIGLIIMILSTWRFIATTRLIKSESQETYGFRGVLVLGGSFIALAVFVLLYVSRMIHWN